MGVPNLKESLPVACVVFQGLFHGAEDGALAGGGAADVVEGAAVGFHCPAIFRRVGQGTAVEAQYPGRIVLVDLVAQALRFPVLQDPDTAQGPVVLDADGQFHHAVVAPGAHGTEYDAHGFSAEADAIDLGRRSGAEIRGHIDAQPVRGQVVIALKRQYFGADLKDGQVLVAGDVILQELPQGINPQHRRETDEQQRQRLDEQVCLFGHYFSPKALGRVSRSISGTKILARSTANATPSGNAPHWRSRQINIPIMAP